VAKDGLVRSLLHFVVPAAFSLAVVALVAYAGFYALEHGRLLALAPELGQEIVRASAIAVAQNAVTTLAVFCGLLLILFVEPPARPWTGGNRLSGDLRPTLLVALLLAAYLAILVLEPARAFFELRPLAVAEYLALGLAALGWALALRQTWRLRLLERLLDVDLGPGSAGDP
jgi:cation-transporting ATPase E